MPIEEYRYVPIEDKIITRGDVQKLANEISAAYKKKGRDKSKEMEFHVYCEDLVIFRSGDPEIFSDDSPITSKRVRKVEMKFSSKSQLIEINLEHTVSKNSESSIVVTGEDSNWVNGTLKKLEEIVDSFSPQNTVISGHRDFLQLVFAMTIGLTTINLALFMGQLVLSQIAQPSPWAISKEGIEWIRSNNNILSILFMMLKYAGAVLIGINPANELMTWLEGIFPSVELQISPEHKMTEKRRRALFASLISVTGGVGLAIQILVDIVRGGF
jgi:hypothetical protein